MVPGTTERDYYQGRVTGAVEVQRAWAAARTPPPDDPGQDPPSSQADLPSSQADLPSSQAQEGVSR
jgi:hypothetical protein